MSVSILKPIIIGLGLGCLILIVKPQLLQNTPTLRPLKTALEHQYSYAIEQSAPAVVSINVYNANNNYDGSVNHKDTINLVSSASGIIARNDGYILTNYHVIMSALTNTGVIQVQMRDGTSFVAKVAGFDKRTDIAVLKINSKQSLPTIPINTNRTNNLGDVVLAIGNPYNIGQTITHGIISALRRSGSGVTEANTIDLRAGIQDLIQTDAPINAGNSGGALVNIYGELVAMNTATLNNPEAQAYGISFAIPTPLVLKVLNDIIKHGRVIRGYLGILADNQILGMHSKYTGIVISSVDPNGPSCNILYPGDIITHINNKQVENLKNAMEIIADSTPHSIVSFRIIRNNQVLEAHVTVGEESNNQ